MTINNDDTRYDRTETDLKDAFQILAGRKELDKITVSEITKLTGVTRSTFYNHYEDMPSFIDAMESRIVDEIFQMLKSFKSKGSTELSRKFFDSLCSYIRKNAFLIRILVSPNGYLFVEKALSMFHIYVASTLGESGKSDTEQQAFSYALAYSIGGTLGILHKWALENCQEPEAVVASHLTELYLNGMRPWLF